MDKPEEKNQKEQIEKFIEIAEGWIHGTIWAFVSAKYTGGDPSLDAMTTELKRLFDMLPKSEVSK